MKNKIFTATLFVLVIFALATVAWSMSHYNNKPIQSPTLNEVSQTETEIISMEKPASFDGVEMVTYKSPYGYEITYPKAWVGVETKGERKIPIDDTLITFLSGYSIDPPLSQEQMKSLGPRMTSMLEIVVSSGEDLESVNKKIVAGKYGLKQTTDVILNGVHGIRAEEQYRANIYLEKGGMLYKITYFDSESLGVTKQEALWILSTFKIVE